MGYALAVAAGLLYGATLPASKALLDGLSPAALAGLCYIGGGLGLSVYRVFVVSREAPLTRHAAPWLLGAAAAGGVLAPLCLFAGLRLSSASTVSLILSIEALLTALLAAMVFREAVGKTVWASIALGTLAAGVLSYDPVRVRLAFEPGLWLAAAAGLLWALDNNLTGRISAKDPVRIVAIKGWTAGTVNLAVAWFSSSGTAPAAGAVASALVVGALGYGLSLVLLVRAMRELGASRGVAVFGLYPFFGAALSLLFLKEPWSWNLAFSAVLMASALWLLLRESHEHGHRHALMTHDHLHVHDEHHAHEGGEAPAGESHSHPHEHAGLEHSHPHAPDIHHRHGHG